MSGTQHLDYKDFEAFADGSICDLRFCLQTNRRTKVKLLMGTGSSLGDGLSGD
jgi:hypothetical protein